MAINLIVEDGTRPVGANSYASLEDAETYMADRGIGSWEDATEDEKAAALIKATDYLNGLSWCGRKVALRSMAWPRIDVVIDGFVVSSDEIPADVVQATCYMAGEIIGGAEPLAAQDRAMSSMTVGAVSMTWDATAPQSPQYPALKSILRGYIIAQNQFRLVRA